VDIRPTLPVRKELVGVDVFLDWSAGERDPATLGRMLEAAVGDTTAGGLALKMITNRGVKVYPDGFPETFRTDHWRCRFTAESAPVSFPQILDLLRRIDAAGLAVIKTEHLYTYDGARGYSLGQGE
jgi:isocitrate dehydrogenase